MKKQFDSARKRYTLCILVQDIPGVLSQVARLFSRKGYNIESIVSGATDRPHITRISIEIIADEMMIEQIAAQCRKLLPVLAVKVLDSEGSIHREIALIKVRTEDRDGREEIIQIANIFRAKIIDICRDSLTIAVFGTPVKNDALIDTLADFSILEIAKSGTLAMERGPETIYQALQDME